MCLWKRWRVARLSSRRIVRVGRVRSLTADGTVRSSQLATTKRSPVRWQKCWPRGQNRFVSASERPYSPPSAAATGICTYWGSAMNSQDMPRAKVALLLPTFNGGGMERFVLNLAAALRGEDTTVDLVVGWPVGALRNLIPTGVNLVTLESRHMLGALPKLIRYLRRVQPAGLV